MLRKGSAMVKNKGEQLIVMFNNWPLDLSATPYTSQLAQAAELTAFGRSKKSCLSQRSSP